MLEETQMTSLTDHEPHGTHQTKKATASGWIGSALEYYDFFIYATAASLIFPQIFFPSENPTVAIVASLATYGVGYVARPIGAFVLGHWGDTHGRKTVLLVCMFLMGFSTMAVGVLPTYHQVGMLAPVLLVILRLIQGFAVAGEISGASSMILEHAPFGRRGYYALVIPYVGNLSDKIGRRPPIIVGALGSGLLSFGYLYAISIHSVPLAIALSLLMWGVVYQGYNAIFPSFYPELFQTRTRVSAMAIAQNVGTTITALLPAFFAAVAPPGSTNIPLTIGAITFAVTIIAAIAAWSARETYRVHLNDLGHPGAVPVPKPEYDRLRAQTLADARLAKASA